MPDKLSFNYSDKKMTARTLKKNSKRTLLSKIIYYKSFYIMLFSGIVYFIIFKYLPMWGVAIAFKDFYPFRGFSGSEWVGLKHFVKLFNSPDFYNILRNTILISLYKLLMGFPAPIILALLLNELYNMTFKRIIQTIAYLPHFVSWVILGGIMTLILSPSSGVVNYVIEALGGKPIYFLASTEWFRSVLVASDIWKHAGWGTIIYLAAIAGINMEQYEAAIVDGANRFKQMWHITVPSIRSIIVVLLILRLGHIMDVGFAQIFILYNPAVYDVGDVLETFVYRCGIAHGNFSFATAVGLFKSVVGLILLVVADRVAKLVGESGIW